MRQPSRNVAAATLFCTLLCSPILFAQSGSSGENDLSKASKHGMMLQHVTLVVSDFSKSQMFYKDILKLKEVEAPWLPDRQMFLSLGDNLELHVGEVEGVEINPSDFNHFAIAVDNFDQFLEHLKEVGVIYTSLGGGTEYVVQERPDGVRQTFIQDPDGYWVEINDATKER